jgi:hypothetical protein
MSARAPQRQSARTRQSGAVAVLAAVSITALLGFVALVIETGRMFQIHRSLQASTDSAALAGAREFQRILQNNAIELAKVPPGQTVDAAAAADAKAKQYDASGTAHNLLAGLHESTSTTPRCLTSLTGLGVACAGSSIPYNALEVTQTVTIPSLFAGITKKASWTVSASSLAGRTGGANVRPVNIVFVLDTTSAMNSTTSSGCGKTRLKCALDGIQILLNQLKPSAAKVGLLVFPPVTPVSVSSSYDCDRTAPTQLATVPYFETNGVYTLLGTATSLVEDYKASNTAQTLSTSSNLNKAVGAGGADCVSLASNGAGGSYYRDAILAAQSLLSAQPNKDSADSVIVLLSYGNSGAVTQSNIVQNWAKNLTYEFGDEVSGSGGFYRYVATAPSLSADGNEPGKGVNALSYWRFLGTTISATKAQNQCAGAVTEAAAAKAAGTRIFSVGYAPSTLKNSQNCNFDSTAITPCQTLRSIASDPTMFYSTSTTSSCVSGGGMTLTRIFDSIAQNLMQPRLLPLGAQ